MERSLMEQSTATEEQIRNAIDQGAVTKQYLAQPEYVVSSLNRLRSTEITSYLQYKQHGYMAVSLLSPGLKSEFEAHAAQELAHADRLAIRIQQLGGVPIFNLQELAGKAAGIGVHPEQGTTLTEMVIENLHKNAAQAKAIILEVIPQIPKAPAWPCHSALKNALMTDRKFWPPQTVKELRPLLEKYL